MGQHRKFRPRERWILLVWQSFGGNWAVVWQGIESQDPRAWYRAAVTEFGAYAVRLMDTHTGEVLGSLTERTEEREEVEA